MREKLVTWQIVSPVRESAYLLVTVTACLVIVLYPVFDYDLYWHLAFGREIASRGQIVAEDLFSYTQLGRQFDNRYWLAQWLFFRIWEWGGGVGLLGLKLLITALIATLVFFTSRNLGAGAGSAAVTTILAVLTGFYRFNTRPELFSLLFFAFLGFLLLSHQAGRLRAIWLGSIPIVMLIWDWLHGGVYGFAFLATFVAAENLRWLIKGTPQKTAIRALNLTFTAALVLMLLNPWGLLTYGVFADQVITTPSATQILEYRPVNWNEFSPFYFMLFWAALLSALRPRSIKIGQAVMVLAFAALAWRISRATGIFALACAPFIAGLLSCRSGEPAWKSRIATATTVLAAVFVGGYGAWVKFVETSPQAIGWRLDDQYLPAGAVRFIKKTGLDGRLYNTGHIGGYLAFELFPQRRIFQYNHGQIFGDTYRFTRVPGELARWNITYAIVADPGELQVLFPRRNWARIYRDPGAVLLVRRLPQYARLIEDYELRHFHPMMTEDMFRRLARSPTSRHRLVHEVSVYLAYRRDPRIAGLLMKAMREYPELAQLAGIASLLRMAFRCHEDIPGFRAFSIDGAGAGENR